MSTIGLISALLLCIYPFLIYPGLLRLWFGRAKGSSKRPIDGAAVPDVALIICALNEQGVIAAKIENSLALDYPADKLHVIVISDGSTDSTAEIVARYRGRGIELVDQSVRRGKIANLNAVLPTRHEEVVVLSDANVMYRADAIRRVVARFSDPSVGCVSGRVILTDSDPLLHSPTEQYYSLEWFLQEAGSAIYSMPGADGAMYALRRQLFLPCAPDTIIEDFVIPMSVIRQGFRVVLEPDAIGWEQGSTSLREEFRRKVRIAAGAMQSLIRGNGWPGKAPARFWFVFVSHKLLRWLSPVTGAMLLVLACVSVRRSFSQLVLAAFAVAAILAIVRLRTNSRHPLLSAAFYFVFGQVATAYGLAKGLVGRQTVLWAKVNR